MIELKKIQALNAIYFEINHYLIFKLTPPTEICLKYLNDTITNCHEKPITMNQLSKMLMCAAVLLLLSGCDSNEKFSGYSKGSAYRILKERGNYTLFLDAIERSGYQRLADGGGLITLFAPDDDAMRDYLSANCGSACLDDLTDEDLRLLVGYHMIQFSYTPKDFRSFSSTASDGKDSEGDGSCYKFKTYMKRSPYVHTDPLTRRKVNVYSREKYMPVMSHRLFVSRGVSNAEADYRRFFPEVDWDQSSQETIYIGNARVIEEGIPSDNGYVYTVDKVLEPSPTVYEELNGTSGEEYSIMKRLFDRISCYTYDAAVTRNYSSNGDSLYYFYHWTAPTRAGEIPEIASDWTYHDEAGVVFERGLRYCDVCFFPKDEVLEPYLKDYFEEWGTKEADDFVSVIPKNGIYHFLQAHIFGNRDIILPSELDMAPVIGVNGEKYNVPSAEVDVNFCSNGVIYGMNKVFEPGVFSHITEPLFRSPDYKFWSYAFNTKNMYQQTVDDNNRFTLFVQNDEKLATLGYTASESTQANGSYTLRKGGIMQDAGIANFVLSHFVYGDVDFSNYDFLRYYVSKDDKTYFYVEDNYLYDSSGQPIDCTLLAETKNGIVYEIDNVIPARTGNFQASVKDPRASEFARLLKNAGIIKDDFGYNTSEEGPLKPSMIFLPTNEAVAEAQANGWIPEDDVTLKKYLKSYFVPLERNKVEHFLLPGLGPDGMLTEGYSKVCVTSSPYSNEADAIYYTISWDPADPKVMSFSNSEGTVLRTIPESGIDLRTNCAAYFLDSCFDYHEIFTK